MPLFLHALVAWSRRRPAVALLGSGLPRLAHLWAPVSVAPGGATRGGQSADGARRGHGACGDGKNAARRAERPRHPQRGNTRPGTHAAPDPAGPAGCRARTAGRDAGAGAPPGGDLTRAQGAASAPGPNPTPAPKPQPAPVVAPWPAPAGGASPLPVSRASKSASCAATKPPRLRDRRPPSPVATRPICRRAAMPKADWSPACLPRVARWGIAGALCRDQSLLRPVSTRWAWPEPAGHGTLSRAVSSWAKRRPTWPVARPRPARYAVVCLSGWRHV